MICIVAAPAPDPSGAQRADGAAGRPACVRGSSCVRALRAQRNGRRAAAAQGAVALLRRGSAAPAPLSERATDARPRRTQRRGASTQRRASRRTPIATARRAEPSSLAACAEASSDAGRLAQGRSFWAHELQRPLRSNPVCRCSLEQSGLVLHFLFSRNSLLRVAPLFTTKRKDSSECALSLSPNIIFALRRFPPNLSD